METVKAGPCVRPMLYDDCYSKYSRSTCRTTKSPNCSDTSRQRAQLDVSIHVRSARLNVRVNAASSASRREPFFSDSRRSNSDRPTLMQRFCRADCNQVSGNGVSMTLPDRPDQLLFEVCKCPCRWSPGDFNPASSLFPDPSGCPDRGRYARRCRSERCRNMQIKQLDRSSPAVRQLMRSR
jgi:hypothetical protein